MAWPKGKPRPPKSGRRSGTPNKATQDVRAAIALIAQQNVDKVQEWLTRTAKDDPARAVDLFLRAIEYHIPKLARTEILTPAGQSLNVNIVNYGGRPSPEPLGPEAISASGVAGTRSG